MGIRGELFSKVVQLDKRTYFFNVKENRFGDLYLNIVESKNKETGGFDRQSIVLFSEDLKDFLGGFDEALKILEKSNREKQKAAPRPRARSGQGPEAGTDERAPFRKKTFNTDAVKASGDEGERSEGKKRVWKKKDDADGASSRTGSSRAGSAGTGSTRRAPSRGASAFGGATRGAHSPEGPSRGPGAASGFRSGGGYQDSTGKKGAGFKSGPKSAARKVRSVKPRSDD